MLAKLLYKLRKLFWSLHSYNWDDYIDTTGYYPEIETICRIIEEHKTDSSADILDIGCATGNYSLALAECGYKVSGFDFSPAMIRKAERKARRLKLSNINFQVSDFNQPFNYKTSGFDFVIAAHTMQGVNAKIEYLKEISRVLKTNGSLIVVTKKKRNNRQQEKRNKNIVLTFIIDILKPVIFPGYRKSLFDIDSLTSEIEQSGFSISYTTDTNTNHIILFKKSHHQR